VNAFGLVGDRPSTEAAATERYLSLTRFDGHPRGVRAACSSFAFTSVCHRFCDAGRRGAPSGRVAASAVLNGVLLSGFAAMPVSALPGA
jgi:hypothetical protein